MLKEEVLRLLREDAAFREEIRRQILTDELLGLPEKVERLRAEMHEEFGKVWRAIGSLSERTDALVEAQRRTEARLEALTARVDALAEAQRQTEARLAALTARVDSLAERLEALTARVDSLAQRLEALTARVDSLAQQLEALTRRVDALTQTIGRMEERWGLAHEQIAQDLLPEILRRKGWTVLRTTPLVFDGEMDLVVAVEAEGRAFTLAVEVKGRVWSRTPMDQVLAKARQPAFVAAIRREGFSEPIVAAVFGLVIYSGAEEAARQAGVGLFSPNGELVAPPSTLAK